jgi:phage gp36-like protein
MYSTLDLILAKLGSFATLITTGMETADIEGFISEADDTIDGYIAAAVTLPFTSTPKLITTISTSIAVRNLWAQKQAKTLPEHVIKDYDNAIKLLEMIARGTIKLTAQDHTSDTYNDCKYAAATRNFSAPL